MLSSPGACLATWWNSPADLAAIALDDDAEAGHQARGVALAAAYSASMNASWNSLAPIAVVV